MTWSSSGDEPTDSDRDDKDEEDPTMDPNPLQLHLVLKHFPMKGVKVSSIIATGCD
jgi:hypothetical protein